MKIILRSTDDDMASFWRGYLVLSKAFLQGSLRLPVDFDLGNARIHSINNQLEPSFSACAM